MQRYFVKNTQILEHKILIEQQDFHHLRNVMRTSVGDFVEVVDEEGSLYRCKVNTLLKDSALLSIEKKTIATHTRASITIAQAMIKKDRFELFLEKATELGVYRIIPTQFLRSVVKIDQEDSSKKIDRYKTIVKEASEQSERLFLPIVESFTPLKKIAFEKYDHVIVCYEMETTEHHIKEVIPLINRLDKVLVVIGPEGGIDPEELRFLETKDAQFVSLGSQIYRSETAAMVALSFFAYEWKL